MRYGLGSEAGYSPTPCNIETIKLSTEYCLICLYLSLCDHWLLNSFETYSHMSTFFKHEDCTSFEILGYKNGLFSNIRTTAGENNPKVGMNLKKNDLKSQSCQNAQL